VRYPPGSSPKLELPPSQSEGVHVGSPTIILSTLQQYELEGHINLFTVTSKIHSSKIQRLRGNFHQKTWTIPMSENTNQSNPLLGNYSLKSPMILNNTNYQENPFLRRQTGRDSPVVSWAEQEILSSDQTEQESPHQSTLHWITFTEM